MGPAAVASGQVGDADCRRAFYSLCIEVIVAL